MHRIVTSRAFEVKYSKFIAEYKKLEEEKRRCLQLYFQNQALIQLHSVNLIRCLNNMLSLDMFAHFRHSDEILLSRTVRRKFSKINRATRFWEETVPEFTEDEFKEHFRMNRASLYKLCNKLSSITREDTKIRKAIPLDKRIAIALNALGSGKSYKAIANVFGIGRTTVGEIVVKFVRAVCQAMQDDYINGYPPTPERLEEIVTGFERMGIPQCYGILDTCHIKISSNRSYSKKYRNSRGGYSVMLLATVDHRGSFISMEAGLNGSISDRLAYEKSGLKQELETNELFKMKSKVIAETQVPIFLVASSNFRLSKHLMKPYKDSDSLSEEAEMFNNILSQCQGIISDTFVGMKARFAMLSQGLEVRETNCHTIIKACCILYNFLNEEFDFVMGSWLNELEDRENNETNTDLAQVLEEDVDEDGIAIRGALASYMSKEVAC